MGNEYCICPSKLTSLNGNGPTKVTVLSPWYHRNAVERNARYFRQEFNFSHLQFGAKQKSTDPDYVPYEAYLFHRETYNLQYEDKNTEVVCAGACCFFNENNSWSLHWVWLHPYFRGKGFLRDAWPLFREKYNDFSIQEPISPQMQKFLKQIDA